MWYWLAVTCILFYFLCSAWFLLANAFQLHLVWQARKNQSVKDRQSGDCTTLPTVTIQVPVYNERFVIKRLLIALGQLNYPTNLYDIQVLDDSTDDTSQIIAETAKLLTQQGVRVNILRRQNRTEYKAGALQAGLEQCQGELIAIFDADFIPRADFLNRMCVYFTDDRVGGVQARWTHHNMYENPLTIIQAILLDSHFSVEHQGRASAGYFLNFNGTAGLWRKQCILDSGGWNGKVLTEDLELSYRAQLKGWKFLYDHQTTVPAELPAGMNAFKSQQFRWAKGMAQTASKHLKQVINLNVSPAKKLHAMFHLLSSMSFLSIMGNILLTAPILSIRHYYPELRQLSSILLLTGITFPAVCVYYYFGTVSTMTRKIYWQYLPLFFTVYSSLSVQNSVAVIQGLAGHRSPFVRTPKLSGQTTRTYNDSFWKSYNWFELLIALYIFGVIGLSIVWNDYFLMLFLVITLTGLIILNVPAILKLRLPFRNADQLKKNSKSTIEQAA